MSTIDLTLDTFETAIEQNAILFVDFWAAWCGPCRQFAPVFEKASEQHPDIKFAKVDTELEQQLAGMLAITSIPTLMVFRENVLIFSQPGALPAPALEQLIEAVRNVDMSQVHQKLREQEAQ
jgi:thioredoxin 1